MRDFVGGGYFGVDSASFVVVRSGGGEADVGSGEPVRADADNLVDGPGGSDVADCRRRGDYVAAYMRSRPEGPEHGGRAGAGFSEGADGSAAGRGAPEGTLRVGIVKELTEDEQVTPEVRRAFPAGGGDAGGFGGGGGGGVGAAGADGRG